MGELNINPEYEKLLPPLSEAQYRILKDSIASEGLRDPIVVHKGTVIEGHHRKRACEELGIPLKTVEFDIQKRRDQNLKRGLTGQMTDDEIIRQWILENQFSRRNTNRWLRCVAAIETESLVPYGEAVKALCQIYGASPPNRENVLAARAEVSTPTYQKAKSVLKALDSGVLPASVRQGLDSEEISISAAYKAAAALVHQKISSAEKARCPNFDSSRSADGKTQKVTTKRQKQPPTVLVLENQDRGEEDYFSDLMDKCEAAASLLAQNSHKLELLIANSLTSNRFAERPDIFVKKVREHCKFIANAARCGYNRRSGCRAN